jgi:tetratricopeptide (TPR) repeat protein
MGRPLIGRVSTDWQGTARRKAGDQAGYVSLSEERLALARQHEAELDYVHFTHVVRDLGMAYEAVKEYEKALPCLQEAYARAKDPKCRFCQVSTPRQAGKKRYENGVSDHATEDMLRI